MAHVLDFNQFQSIFEHTHKTKKNKLKVDERVTNFFCDSKIK